MDSWGTPCSLQCEYPMRLLCDSLRRGIANALSARRRTPPAKPLPDLGVLHLSGGEFQGLVGQFHVSPTVVTDKAVLDPESAANVTEGSNGGPISPISGRLNVVGDVPGL